jgi:hypothetical protein
MDRNAGRSSVTVGARSITDSAASGHSCIRGISNGWMLAVVIWRGVSVVCVARSVRCATVGVGRLDERRVDMTMACTGGV